MIDLEALARALDAHSRLVRVVLAEARGSTPREAGAEMLVWDNGSAGSIGGGRLEFDAIARAQAMLAAGPELHLARLALGPALGQCCGGAAVLVWEVFDAARLRALRADGAAGGVLARPVVAGAGPLPARVRHNIAAAGRSGPAPPARLVAGWLVEPVRRDRLPVWIYGAGHVGRALALILAPLPQFEVSLVDPRAECLEGLPEGLRPVHHPAPAEAVATAPAPAAHLVMTHDHALDLALCHQLLRHGVAHAGLIGSATKWTRFRRRLAALGHAEAQIERIACPIGAPELGKHPQAIAVGVAAALLRAHDQIRSHSLTRPPQEHRA